MSYYVHPQGICETESVGDGTRVWAFTHVLRGAVIGNDVNINDHVFIENDVVVGNRVTVKSGVQLWDGVRLGDDVFVGPNVSFTNDHFPRSKQYPEKFLQTIVNSGASLGAGSVILPGIRIGHKAMIGAGAVVTRDVPPYAIIVGSPGRIVGFDTDSSNSAVVHGAGDDELKAAQTLPGGCELIPVKVSRDKRGTLAAIEFDAGLPFTPLRFFTVSDVPAHEARGLHAHRQCAQFLVTSKGSARCLVDDGRYRSDILLSDPSTGLYIPPLVWGTQYEFSYDAVLSVFASLPYDYWDYVRDYEEFLSLFD